MPSVTDLAHERDSEGKLLPVEKQVEVRGEDDPVDVEVYPATNGQRNEWKRKLQNADEELGVELENELFDTFTPYDPEAFGVSEWSEIRPALADALANAIYSEIFDVEEDDFSKAVQDAMDEVTENLGNLLKAEN